MKSLLLFAAAVLTVQPVRSARELLQTADLLNTGFLPQQQAVTKVPGILRLESDLSPDGSFTYTFDTENGISAHAEGTSSKTADPDQSILTVRGQYSYTGPDGVYTVQYLAGHNGYQAFGEHLPTPPPIPEAILRSLEHNAAHPEEDDGIVAASPALASATTPLQPIVAAPPAHLEPLANPTAAPSTRSPALPTLPKQQQPVAQTQALQHQQLEAHQPHQLQQLHLSQLQAQQQLQSQPLQLAHLQSRQLQPQLQPQQLQFPQLQSQQLQSQPLQLAHLQSRQLQPQLQPQQLQLPQLQSQQLQSQPLQLAHLQSRQLQPQLQTQHGQHHLDQQRQPQDFLAQFTPSFQTFESQRTNVK